MSELALQLIRENKKTKNPYLDLGNCGMTEVPEEIGDCVWLEELVLSSEWWDPMTDKIKKSVNRRNQNNISWLPASLGQLSRLRIFITTGVGGQPLFSLSDLGPLKYLKELEHLDIANTQVSDLTQISSLFKLTKFRVSGTQISDLYSTESGFDEVGALSLSTCWHREV